MVILFHGHLQEALDLKELEKVHLLLPKLPLKKQLLKHRNIGEIIVPDRDEDLKQIFQYIMHELGMPSKYGADGRPIFRAETKQFFIEQAKRLFERGTALSAKKSENTGRKVKFGGIILGCTEIELVLLQEDFPAGENFIKLFPSAELHIQAAAEVAVGKRSLKEFLP